MLPKWHSRRTDTAEDTIKLGQDFAKFVQFGDVFALSGELASGKTTFMKGVALGLGIDDDVTSPTFTLINEYGQNNQLIHIDCYRESNIERWLQLGITEYFDDRKMVFIEWPERIKSILPENLITIEFHHINKSIREITLIS